jgi:hypothetical protein
MAIVLLEVCGTHRLQVRKFSAANRRSIGASKPSWKMSKKRFTEVIYDWATLARVFVLGKPFRPSLMLVGKAGVYHNGEHLKGAHAGRL